MIQFTSTAMCITAAEIPVVMEHFGCLGKRAINVGVDVRGFYPVSLEEIIKLADG